MPEVLSAEEVGAIIEAAPGPKYRAAIPGTQSWALGLFPAPQRHIGTSNRRTPNAARDVKAPRSNALATPTLECGLDPNRQSATPHATTALSSAVA
jgi:hypothetical protein